MPASELCASMCCPKLRCKACRGVFGCHTALVLRRLRRLCHREYRTDPRFVITSATIANPDSHAATLLGEALAPVTCLHPAPARIVDLIASAGLRAGPCAPCCGSWRIHDMSQSHWRGPKLQLIEPTRRTWTA